MSVDDGGGAEAPLEKEISYEQPYEPGRSRDKGYSELKNSEA